MLGLGKKPKQQSIEEAQPQQAATEVATPNAQPAAQTAPQAPHAGGKPQAKTPIKAAPAGQSKGYSALKDGSVSVIDLISPSSVEVDFKNVRVGDKFFRTFFVVDYPRQV